MEVHNSQGIETVTDDMDVFQCGKCKGQFTTLSYFMHHKQICTGLNSHHAVRPQQLQQHPCPNQTIDAVSTSALDQFPANIVLPDDMMTLTLDAVSTAQLHMIGSSANYHNSTRLHPVSSQVNLISGSTCDPDSVSMSSTSLSTSGAAAAVEYQIHPLTVIPSNQNNPTSVVHSQQTVNSIGDGVITVLVDGTEQTFNLPTSNHMLQESHIVPMQRSDSTLNASSSFEKADQHIADHATKTRHKIRKQQPKRSLYCQWCKKVFLKAFDLQQHIRAHTGEKPFQCVVCGRAFSQKSNVKKHMETHKVWPLGAKVNPTLPEQPAPQLIVTQHRDISQSANCRSDSCQSGSCQSGSCQSGSCQSGSCQSGSCQSGSCQSGSCQSGSCQSHSINSSTAEGYSKNDDITSIKWHFLVDSSYICPYCPASQSRFDNFYKLRSHLVTHKTEQVYKCILKTCDKTFVELDDFLEHTRVHESRNELTYRCHVCNKHFECLEDLGTHQYIHSAPGDKRGTEMENRNSRNAWKWRCLECPRTYSSSEALENHLASTTHSFPCPHCEKVFTSNKLLRIHLTTHRNESFRCEICDKELKSEYYLKVHKLIHTGELPFACEVCGKRFNRKDKVNRHMLIHQAVKNFICPFKSLTGCDRSFFRSDKLKEHLKKHSAGDQLKNGVISTSKSSSTVDCSSSHLNIPGSVTTRSIDNHDTSNVLIIPESTERLETMLSTNYKCQSCSSVFTSQESLTSHEMLCEKLPKMKCLKCLSMFMTSEEYEFHYCKPLPIESVYVSHNSSNNLKLSKKSSNKKRKKIYRIELSPPPIRRRIRSRRSRPDVLAVQADSNDNDAIHVILEADQ